MYNKDFTYVVDLPPLRPSYKRVVQPSDFLVHRRGIQVLAMSVQVPGNHPRQSHNETKQHQHHYGQEGFVVVRLAIDGVVRPQQLHARQIIAIKIQKDFSRHGGVCQHLYTTGREMVDNKYNL